MTVGRSEKQAALRSEEATGAGELGGMGRVRKFFVHLIESPSSNDLLDGITEGRTLTEALRLSDIEVDYNLVTDKQTFGKAIRSRLIAAIKKYKILPILHLSMHGDSEGICLTDGSSLSWCDLRGVLLSTSEALRSKLLIAMSSCRGFSGIQMAMVEDTALPFCVMIGHTGEPCWNDTAIAFTVFYHLLAKGVQFKEAVEAMKTASGDQDFLAVSAPFIQQVYLKTLQQKRLEQALERLAKLGKVT